MQHQSLLYDRREQRLVLRVLVTEVRLSQSRDSRSPTRLLGAERVELGRSVVRLTLAARQLQQGMCGDHVIGSTGGLQLHVVVRDGVFHHPAPNVTQLSLVALWSEVVTERREVVASCFALRQL